MPYLEWNPAFDTGIGGIDYEHHRLVDMLNEIHELMLKGAEPGETAAILADFHALASAHFALEEKIMRDQKYPGLAARRDTHYRLLDQVREIMDAHETGSYRVGESLPATLKQWLMEAMGSDARMFGEINDAKLRALGLRRG
ncbi:MAG TPA: bacteriohemerythrin [Kiloniellales bacterium]